MPIEPALISSKSRLHECPDNLFNYFNQKYNLTIDVTATAENAKLPRFLTKEDNCLEQSWKSERAWSNPPYGRPLNPCKPHCKKISCEKRGWHIAEYEAGCGEFVEKAYTEVHRGGCELAVLLLPVRTGVKWWFDYVRRATEIWWIEDRIKFIGNKDPAPFCSTVAVFMPIQLPEGFQFQHWLKKEEFEHL